MKNRIKCVFNYFWSVPLWWPNRSNWILSLFTNAKEQKLLNVRLWQGNQSAELALEVEAAQKMLTLRLASY